ncbi:hypothetical protein B0H12DRAFT_1134800 [Mycena haematopus]|nr:hypothetical protein B0H12DRAFT_1134800 [Mycena haematopus]
MGKPTTDEGERARRAKQKVSTTRRRDDVLVVPDVPDVWCEDDPQNDVTILHFNVSVAEADRAACAALLNSGIFCIEVAPADAETAAGLGDVVRAHSQGAPCVAWPLRRGEEKGDVSAGAPVCGGNEVEHRPRRALEEGAKRGRMPRSGTPRGRLQGPSVRHITPSPPRHEIQWVEQPPRPKPKPKPKVKKPRALHAPSTSHAPMSSQRVDAANSALVVDSPYESQPGYMALGPDVQQTEVAEEEAPIPLSAKAMGKQRMSDFSRRTLSPEPINAWIHSSGSRARRRSASRGHSDDSPIHQNVYNPEFGSSPPRIYGMKTSPEGLDYYPTAPAMPGYISTSFIHASDSELPPPVPSLFTIPDEPYGDGTVDPSMLMGGTMVPDMMEPYGREPETEDLDEPGEEEGSYENIEEAVQVASPFSLSSSTASSSSIAPAAPQSSPLMLRASRRAPVQRRVPDDMVATDLLDSDATSSSSSSAYIEDRPPSPKSASNPKTAKPKPAAVKRRMLKAAVDDTVVPASHNADPFYRYVGPPWPPGDPDPFCHQCRRKTKRLSMRFDDCPHTYCVGCIMTKYEPNTVPFEPTSSSTNCAKCNDICSCDNCTRGRGEEYQFARSAKPRAKLAPRAPLAVTRPQRNQYKFLDDMVIEPTTYHSILYDLTGAPIARTFFGADGNTNFVVAQPRRRRREFIGVVHESWRSLGPDPVVYVDPPLLGKRKRNGAKKRLYIGDQSVLSLPVRARARPSPPSAAPVPAISAEDLVTPIEDTSACSDSASIPAPGPTDMQVDLPDAGIPLEAVPAAPAPTTPLWTPIPADIEVDIDLPDAFDSPLTSIDSETAGGDDADRVFEKAGYQGPGGSSAIAALDEYGSSAAESDDEGPQCVSEAAGKSALDAQGEPDPAGESGHCVSLDAANGTAVQKSPQAEGISCCDAGLAGASALTGSTTSLTDSDMAKAISRALGAIGIQIESLL